MPMFLVAHETKQVIANAEGLLTMSREEFAKTSALVSGQAHSIAMCADQWPELKGALEVIRDRIQHVAANPMLPPDYVAEVIPSLRRALTKIKTPH